MGMFDYVKVPAINCPHCHKKIDSNHDYESKDNDCVMEWIDLDKVNNFYTNCPFCEAWIEYKRKKRKSIIDDFELNWEQMNESE